MTIGEAIEHYRKQKNMTQHELADRLFVSASFVSKWECGSRRPDFSMIIAMSEVLGVRPEDLISRDKLMSGELARYIPKGVSPDSLPDLLSGFLFELTERDSNVFLLRYYYFKNVKEIEDILGISSGNVGVILFRIRTKLKSYLKGKASR